MRTVFLSNLPLTASEISIRTLVTEKIGSVEIEEIRLIRDAKGKIKGFAYLQLKDEHEVESAITQLNNQRFEGRAMRAERSKPKEQVLPKSVNAIVVTNLSYSVREEALKAYVSKTFGVVNSVTLVVDDKKRSKGFAFIEFTDSASCQKAIDAREFKLEGRIALIKQSNREVT